MKAVTVGKAKNELSALLRLVREGQSVLILDRKQPVARLEPIGPTSDEERLAELERQGLIRCQKRALPSDFLTRELPCPKGSTSVVAALLQERAEGR